MFVVYSIIGWAAWNWFLLAIDKNKFDAKKKLDPSITEKYNLGHFWESSWDDIGWSFFGGIIAVLQMDELVGLINYLFTWTMPVYALFYTACGVIAWALYIALEWLYNNGRDLFVNRFSKPKAQP